MEEAGLIYVNQLLDLDGERMITWQQYKGYRGLSSKGKKAEWFKDIEAKVLKSSDSREVKESFKTRSNNTQALKVEWEKISKDKRRKEWIVYGPQGGEKKVGKVIKKGKGEILVEHWQTRCVDKEIATEIGICEGCTEIDDRIIESNKYCQQWISSNSEIKVIPEALLEKRENKIKTSLGQLEEKMKTKEWKVDERELRSLEIIAELEVEIFKRQRIRGNVEVEIISILERSKIRDNEKYVIYSDGAVKLKPKEGATRRNMGLRWVQTNEAQDWSEEEIALRLEGWPSSTLVELVAIWAALLTMPLEKQVEIYTDSETVIRNIRKGLQNTEKSKILKIENAIWIIKIVDLCRIKNLRMVLFKVKSHSKDKWNDRADALAKKGVSSKKIIYTKEIRYKEIEFCLEWGNKRIDILARLLCKLVINARVGAEWRETRAIKSLEPETEP